MINIQSLRLMVVGLGARTGVAYKTPGGAVKRGTLAVTDGHGGAQEPTYVFGCYQQPYGIAWASAAIKANATYDVSGIVVPVDSTVHISRVAGSASSASPEELTAGEVTTVQADDTGAWALEGMEGADGTLYAWVQISGTVLDMMDCAVSCEMTATVSGSAVPIQAVCLDCLPRDSPVIQDDWSYVRYTITGTAPAGVTAVYITADRGGLTELTAEALTKCQLEATVTPYEDGTFSTTVDDNFSSNTLRFVVWCESAVGPLTASMSASGGGTCLSGDTLITLADGGAKRLDEVRPGDLLLAGDGTPTPAVQVTRGRWNDHHILYHFADGIVVDETHCHRFYNAEQGFWQYLERWEIGQHARRQDGAEVALVAVERVDEPAEMFGLWTESHDYWANGLLSGETAANQALLADATAEQAANMVASLDELAILRLLGINGGGILP